MYDLTSFAIYDSGGIKGFFSLSACLRKIEELRSENTFLYSEPTSEAWHIYNKLAELNLEFDIFIAMYNGPDFDLKELGPVLRINNNYYLLRDLYWIYKERNGLHDYYPKL